MPEKHATFENFIHEYILKMMPGTVLTGPYSGSAEENGQAGRGRLELRAGDHEYYLLGRKPGFVKTERDFIRGIIKTCHEKEVFKDELYGRHLVQGIIEDAIARFMAGKNYQTVRQVLSLYASWSSQTYEGNRISHTIGILDKAEKNKGIHISTIKDKDFLKITGSSHDSILILDGTGNVVRAAALEPVNEKDDDETWSPIAMAHIAKWAKEGRVAISLTRNGEILIFRGASLSFVRRRGLWRYLPHGFLAEKMSASVGRAEDPFKLRRAIYHTSIDVAFSRGGACIGLVPSPFEPSAYPCIPKDCLLDSGSPGTAFVRNLVNGKPFHKIPRTIRAELCAIDGATIVDATGKIQTIGAILITQGNAEGGGGRTAAAKTLAEHGLGIKVSNDGYVQVFSAETGSDPDTTGWRFG